MSFRQTVGVAGQFGVLVLSLALASCSGDDGGRSDGAGGGGDSQSRSMEEHFGSKVQPNLDFCRTCHVPGGIADTEAGRDFMLSAAKSQDLANLRASWERLGKNNPTSRILLMSSGQETPHAGGAPWPVGGAQYRNMEILLKCFADANGCGALLGGGVGGGTLLPLLGSNHARSYMDSFCEGRDDGAVLPQDPRELIRPGVNAGKAVAFNAYWQDCTGPGNNPLQKPKTCGEYRSRAAAGETLMRSGLSLQFHGRGLITQDSFNAAWQRWGLSARPENFDAQVRERYGLPKAPFHNPYPLQGENPVATDGGSGELPAGLVQAKDAEGRYNGTIAITCDLCHSGALDAVPGEKGTGFVSGLGANAADMQLLLTDMRAPLPLGFNSTRGVTNAEGLSGLLIGLLDGDSLGFRPEGTLVLQLPGNTSGAGDTKMPAWWNAAYRPRKFWDGGLSYDASRLDSAILNALTPEASPTGADKAFNRALRDTIESQSIDAQAYIESLQSPPFPGAIDTPLAEQGAVLFHARDLWAGDVNADIPRPPTNGSCAGCHGVYSPRYANDPAYLEDPRLAGIAGYIAPLDQIRTDPERVRGFTTTLLEVMSTSWFAYPEGSEGYVSPDEKNALVERLDDLGVTVPGMRPRGACTWQGTLPEDAVGYLTPPLHGIWATAPYLHNASVPDVWGVLDPEQRPAMWRRQLTAGEGSEHGYDTSMAAYDTERLGWKHQEMLCGAGGIPYLSCEPEQVPPAFSAVVDFINRLPGSINSLGYQVIPPVGREAVEARKIFNRHQFAKSTAGHDFTRALSDAERRALIEYLKTL